MGNEKLIPLIISLIALLVTIIATILNFKRTKKYNSNDFKLSQKVKDETLELLSTLRALILKAIHSTQGIKSLTITEEKKRINLFLHSSTAFAFYVWVGQKSKFTGDKPEEWRTFFLRLSQILSIDDVYSAGCIAVELEILFDKLSEDDFSKISSYLSNVPDALKKFKTSREYDTSIQTFINVCTDRKMKDCLVEQKLRHIKSKGINDPNIDLFLGVFSDDTDIVKSSLRAGADPSITDIKLLSQYREQLKDFREE